MRVFSGQDARKTRVLEMATEQLLWEGLDNGATGARARADGRRQNLQINARLDAKRQDFPSRGNLGLRRQVVAEFHDCAVAAWTAVEQLRSDSRKDRSDAF